MRKLLEKLIMHERTDYSDNGYNDVNLLKERIKYIKSMRELIEREKEKVKTSYYQGASGRDVVKANTMIVDDVIKKVFCVLSESFDKINGRGNQSCVIAAIGGYGRGDLNPYSDVDILFLYGKNIDEFTRWVARNMVSLLWDIGFEIGHSTRSIKDCFRIAKSDITAKTAMMESRFIIGNKELFNEFYNSFNREVVRKEVDSYINSKIAEREKIYSAYCNTVSVSEPNIKEGAGGLRDFHNAIWVSLARFGLRDLKAINERGIIDGEELKIATKALDFLLMIRNGLHFTYSNRNDVLAFEVQVDMAKGLGYRDIGIRSAVELFMQDYYIHATNMHNFSIDLIDRCKTYKKRKKAFRFLRQKDIGDGFVSCYNEIYIKDFNIDIFKENPTLLLKVFLYCQRLEMGLNDFTKKVIRSTLPLVDGDLLRSGECSNIFLSLLKGKNLAEILRSMHELGVLRKYIPEFNDLTHLIHSDCYHQYTVDEHTFRSIGYLDELTDTNKGGVIELSRLYKELLRPEVVRLALLFHDIGKGKGKGHIEKGSEIARIIMDRLGLGYGISIEDVNFLIKNHLLMNHIAQRRDMHDQKTIVEFTQKVKDVENLKRLYLLTYADTRAVAKDVWSVWKGALLWELYFRTYSFMTMDETERVTDDTMISEIREDVLRKLAGEIDEEEINRYFNAMPGKYILSTATEKIVRHIRLTNRLKDSTLAMEYSHNLEVGYSELMVCTMGKAGTFSKIAGTLTSKNLNILGAQIYTRSDGIAIDTLQVSWIGGKPILDDELWNRIKNDLISVLDGRKDVKKLLASRQRYVSPERGKGFKIPTEVILDNKTSDIHTVIEVIFQDRLGALYTITNALFGLGIDIYVAKISTEANKAIDVFYVTDLKGRKILEKEKLNKIKRELEEIVG